MVDFMSFLQMGAVIFGTVIAAPLISSDGEKARRYGFASMFIGNSFALLIHVDLSLWVLAAASCFWGVMSLRGILRLNRASPNPTTTLLNPTSDIIPGE